MPAVWSRTTAVVVASVLAAGAALMIRVGAAWTAHDSAGHRRGGKPSSQAAAAPAAGGGSDAASHGPSGSASRPASASPAASAGRARGHPRAAARADDERLAAALAPVLRAHPGRLAAGVTDLATGRTATYHRGRRFDTASIVKADILAVLLLQHQQAHTPLSTEDQELATAMIEDSDNNAASALWDAIEGGPGLEAGNAALHVLDLTPGPGGYWGLTQTTVTAELGLLSALTSARSPLTETSRHYELSLMRNVDPGQAWGVTAAAAPGTGPAVKNGWLPAGPDGQWVINSIGVIRCNGQRLLITVLSGGQPSEAAGIAAVQAAARAAAAAITTASLPSH